MRKTAASIGSAPPDPTKSQATVSPAVPVVVANKTAPGQTGPKGLSPRTTYSRVNTAQPPIPQLGTQAKSLPPRGLESLPKMAHTENLMSNYQKRPVIQDLMKQAMEGTLSRVDIGAEAAHQFGVSVEETKEASAVETESDHVPTEYCEKLASALDYIAKEAADPGSAEVASPGVGVGQGPGALEVSVSDQTEENIDAGEMGQAIAQDVPAMNPGMRGTAEQPAGPANAMDTDEDVTHEEQPVDPMHNESAAIAGMKEASAGDKSKKTHQGRRALLGNPISSAIEARKGKKLKAFTEAVGNNAKEVGKGTGVGAALGAAAGLGTALYAAKKGNLQMGGGKMLKKRSLVGAGSLLGAGVGSVAGGIRGNHGSKATNIHQKYSKHKKEASFEGNLETLHKAAFALTEKGHSFDAEANQLKADHAADMMALSERYGAHRFGGNTPEEGKELGVLKRLGNILRFGTNEGNVGDPRHLEYTAKKHREGKNAYNPLGGGMTPSSREEGGTAMMYGSYKQPGGAKKQASFEGNLAALLKVAEDAINPAKISAGPAAAQGADAPVGASGSEDGPMPAEPSDVNSQKSMISSNEAAINYTKRQAKADPKKDLGHLLSEPALSAAHDKTLERTLSRTNEAGAKIASAQLTKTAAAKALLLKLAKEQCSAEEAKKKKKGKEKDAMGDLSSPQGQSGFSASSMM